MDPSTPEGRFAFLLWWVLHGHHEFPEIAPLIPTETFDGLFLGDGQNLPPLAQEILSRRSDVLDDLSGRGPQALLAWFFVCGIREHGLAPFLSKTVKDWLCGQDTPSDQSRLLGMLSLNDIRHPLGGYNFGPEWELYWALLDNIPSRGLQPLISADWAAKAWETVALPQPASLPMTRLMLAHWLRSGEEQRRYDLQDPRQADDYIAGFLCHRLSELGYDIDPAYLRLMAAPAAESDPSDLLPLPQILRMIWQSLGDLRDSLDITRPHDRWRLISWFIIWGQERVKAGKLVDAAFRRRLGQPVPTLVQDAPAPITPLMLAAREHRGDVRDATDLSTPEGRRHLVLWFLLCGIRELQLTPWLDEALTADLSLPLTGIVQDLPLPLTRLMGVIRDYRPDVAAHTPLDSRTGRMRLLAWSLLHGVIEYHQAHLITEETWARLDNGSSYGQPITLLMELVHLLRDDLQAHYDLTTAPGRDGFAAWWRQFAEQEVPLLSLRKTVAPPARQVHILRPAGHGVNLVGYARNELGIGEDVRCMALAMESADIPFTIINLPPRNNSRAGDLSMERFISNERRYDTNIFCITGFDTVWAYAKLGPKAFENAYNIGNWPWELPRWPEQWGFALNLVDELWGISRFCTDCYRAATDKPVHWMASAIRPLAPAAISRGGLGLPDGPTLFTVLYDANSFHHRKNPLAALDAFELAFGRDCPSAMLVVKTMNARDDDPLWQEMRRRAAGNSAIRLINQTWDYDRTVALLAASDCFVSLHRSEGLGRGIAEAMGLGVPVLATGWSGSADLLENGRGLQVDYQLIPLATGNYPFGEGQVWADPSITDAAEKMRALAAMGSERRTMIETARAHILGTHSIEAAGQRYHQRLAQIWS